MEKNLEDRILDFLKGLAEKEDELEFSVINYFASELRRIGVNLGKVQKGIFVDEGILKRGLSLPTIYFEDIDKIYVIIARNYADSASIEQVLLRAKYFSTKSQKDVIPLIVAISISKKYLDEARELGIRVITEKII